MRMQEIIKPYKALYPEELMERYRLGERNFEGINLLRAELEYILNSRCSEGRSVPFPPEPSVVNPLWADYKYSFDREFEWDSFGRFVPTEYDDLLPPRDLTGVALSGINLAGAYLYPVSLEGANLSGADLREVKLFDSDLSGADLNHADLRGSILDDVNLRGAKLYMVRLDRAIIRSADMQHVDLRRAKLKKAFIVGSNMREANLRKAHFDRTRLNWSKLENIDWRDVELRDCCVNHVSIAASQQSDFLAALGIRLCH